MVKTKRNLEEISKKNRPALQCGSDEYSAKNLSI